MFNPFSSEGPRAGNDDAFSDTLKEARKIIEESEFLNSDKNAWAIFNQAEDGSNIDVIALLQQREAKLRAGEAGVKITGEQLVQHSVDPQTEPRAELN